MTAPAELFAAAYPRWSVPPRDRARHNVVEAVLLVTDRAALPPEVWNARLALLAEIEAAAAVREARRQESLANPTHYTANVGDNHVLCGAHVDRAPHGWVGADNEFIRRSRLVEGHPVGSGTELASP